MTFIATFPQLHKRHCLGFTNKFSPQIRINFSRLFQIPSQEGMVTSHVAHYGISSWHALLSQWGWGASVLVGAKLQTILVTPELLHPSFSLCFNSLHFWALRLAETCEPLVTPPSKRLSGGRWPKAKGGSRGRVGIQKAAANSSSRK